MRQNTKLKRKTHSLDAQRSKEISLCAVDLGVPKQDILDALVLLLKDRTILAKIKKQLAQ